MASLPSFPLLLTLAVVITFFALPTFSTSRRVLEHHHQTTASSGFRVSLKHVDSGKNYTKFERIQRAMKRGKHRMNRLNAMATLAASDETSEELESPIHAGSGEFLMKLSIGTPPSPFSAIMDTGSDLIWTQCKPCTQCYDQPTPIFDPEKSSSYSKLPCDDKLCKSLPTSKCSDGGCEYLYGYGDYSSTQGTMAIETFTFGEKSVAISGIGFGCGEDNEGNGFTQGAGLVGLGRGPLSMVSQLDQPKFSYCLTSIDDSKSSSTLLMGSLVGKMMNGSENGKTATTKLIQNPSQPSFYYLSLEGISVGDTRLQIDKSTFEVQDDGSGGMIIDSGTTITYLESSAFDLLKKEFVSQTKLSVDNSGSTGLDLCFALPSSSSSGEEEIEVPSLTFHFSDGDLDLPGENYMIGDSSLGVVCLAMGGAGGMSIFGNVQQQNMLVVHDLVKETLTFVPTQCDQL